jgi:hypothetical protein
MKWKDSICQVVGTANLSNISNFTYQCDVSDKPAIDIFYTEIRGILTQVPNTVTNRDWLGALSAVAIISITENYFRNILGRVLLICPITRKNATEQSINLGSALWHPYGLIECGAFENVSFSESRKIIEVTKKYIGIDLSNSSFNQLLSEFSKVCELRHSIVHSNCQIAGKNALLLDIPSSHEIIKTGIGYNQLHEIALICNNLVVAYNKRVFETLCLYWATKYRQLNNWDIQKEKETFKKIWDTFHSKIDYQESNISHKMRYDKVMRLVKIEYNL